VSREFGADRPRVISISNQKGGVGKTTTTVNLAAAIAEKGHKVLIIDLDPQGNASTGLGIDQSDRKVSTYDFLFDPTSVESALHKTATTNLWIVPSNADLASADMELAKRSNRTNALSLSMRSSHIAALDFDYILIDCPPSLNLLTLNGLVAADTVLIPLQAEFYALEGLSQLMLTIRDVRQTGNPGLRIEGILITMYDGRNRLAQQVEEDVRRTLGDLVFRTRIPRNVRLSEAPSFAVPILTYDPQSRGSEAYRALAKEILNNRKPQMAQEKRRDDAEKG
jgi:chromosome partitioning protein